jgi:glycerol-1-phosphatase
MMAKNPTPLAGISILLADLDGVIYQGADAIPHAVPALKKVAASVRLGYVTNNASRTPAEVAAQITGFGLPATSESVVTSPQSAARVLKKLLPPGSKILVVGGIGLVSEVEAAGFVVTREADDKPDAVVQGFSPEVGWQNLAQASFALQRKPEIPWVATNTDWTIPVQGGVAPGNGALVSAVHLAVGRLATFAGKPEKEIFDVALERFQVSPENALMVGDRLDTDVLGANRAGMKSALVLTGIDQVKTLLASDVSMRPDFVLEDLRELHKPYPETHRSVDGDVHTIEVGRSVVRRKGHVIRVARAGSQIDLIRAGATIVHDSGLRIFGLDVDPQIYS